MGAFTKPVTLIGPNGESITLDALVDPGRLFSVMPSDLLTSLGVAASRHLGELAIGQVEAELEGQRAYITCEFGANLEPAVIGSHTLTVFLLEADVANQRLVPKEFRLIQHF